MSDCNGECSHSVTCGAGYYQAEQDKSCSHTGTGCSWDLMGSCYQCCKYASPPSSSTYNGNDGGSTYNGNDGGSANNGYNGGSTYNGNDGDSVGVEANLDSPEVSDCSEGDENSENSITGDVGDDLSHIHVRRALQRIRDRMRRLQDCTQISMGLVLGLSLGGVVIISLVLKVTCKFWSSRGKDKLLHQYKEASKDRKTVEIETPEVKVNGEQGATVELPLTFNFGAKRPSKRPSTTPPPQNASMKDNGGDYGRDRLTSDMPSIYDQVEPKEVGV